MLRIAELRREIALDVQQKSDKLRDTYKSKSGMGGTIRPNSPMLPPPSMLQRDAISAAATAADQTAAAAAAAAAVAQAAAAGTPPNMAGSTYLERIGMGGSTGLADSAAGPLKRGSFSKAEVTQEMTKGRKRSSLFAPILANPLKEVREGFASDAGFVGSDSLPLGDSVIRNNWVSAQNLPGTPGGVTMDQLLRQRRTSFERRKWGKEEDQKEGEVKGRMRWGPKQLINGPPGMRLKSILRYQQERDQRNADPNLQMMGSSVREEEVEDTERLRGGRQGSHDYLTPVQGMKVCRHADRWVPDWLNDMNVLLKIVEMTNVCVTISLFPPSACARLTNWALS